MRSLALAAMLLLVARPGAGQVTTIYANDFESAAGPGWSPNAAIFNPTSDAVGLPNRNLLGRYSGSEAVTLTLTGLEAPAAGVVSFDLYTIGSWDGNGEAGFGPDVFRVAVAGGPTLLDATFSIYPSDSQSYPENRPATNPAWAGSLEHPGGYVRYRVTLPFAIAAPEVTLVFSGWNLQGIHDEYWCLDNLEVATVEGSGVAEDDLLAYWSFDDGTATDQTAHRLDGVFRGAGGIGPSDDGLCSKSLSFPGGAWVEVAGDALGMTSATARTVSMWVKPTEITNDAGGGDKTANLVSKYRSFSPGTSNYYGSINLLDALDPRGYPGALTPAITGIGVDAFLASAVGTAVGEWHHVVFVWKAGAEQSRIYVDGLRIAQGSLTYASSISPEPFRLGAVPVVTDGDQTYFGLMDEVRVFGRALTDAEILALYGIATASASGPTEVCSGDSVTLSASPTGPGMTYLWSNGATTPSIEVGAAGSYSVTVTHPNGCAATSAPIAVTTLPAPVVSVGASGATEFCRGGSVTLSASPAGAFAYLWSNGATSPSITVGESGSYSVTVTDGNGCSATSAPIAVTVHEPPVVSVSVPGVSSVEGSLASLPAITFTDAEAADTHAAVVTWGDGTPAEPLAVSEAGGSGSLSGQHAYAEVGVYTATISLTDPHGCASLASVTFTVANALPEVTSLSISPALVALGGSVTADATFTDAGAEDTHLVTWSWGDGTSTTVAAVESGGSGSSASAHTYTAPGVYTVTVTVTDQHLGAGALAFQYVVVYDADGGFVTGAGWFDSPAGAYLADPTRTGKAHFGFVSRYQGGASVPEGTTQLHFGAAGLAFRSTSYDWLVVAGARAQFKGVGELDGVAGYGFLVTAVDGARPGGGGTDRLRIKIWNRTSGAVVYDNQLGAAETDGPSTAIGGGSIVIHAN